MNTHDIERLQAAGLITAEQRDKIIAHFGLKEEGGNKFLAIVSVLGAVLIIAGISLLVASHWDGIPPGVKIATGLALMLGAHAGGWWLREIHGRYRNSGEALHLAGSGLFLANIALIGQIYNLISRPPNALLLWWIGMAALPWILRSKAHHVLVLLAFGFWFGFEINETGSVLQCDSDRQILLYSLLGLSYHGVGWLLRGTSFAEFAGVTEKLGLCVFLIFFFPFTWKEFFGWSHLEKSIWLFPALALAALGALAAGMKRLRALDRQWRWTWIGALLGMMGFMATIWFGCWQFGQGPGFYPWYGSGSWSYVPGVIALFVFCMLQIQVGLRERSPFFVNLGVVFIALDIIAAYIDLIGTMARTGAMFLISGIFLIFMGVYLERKRRKLMKQIKFREIEVTP